MPIPLIGAAIAEMSGAAVFMTALSVMSIMIGYFSRPSMPTPEQQEEVRKGWLVNTCDNTIPLPLVYGRCRIGINRVFTASTGTEQKYLHIIGNLCEGEIEGIVNDGGVDQLFLEDELYTEFGDKVYYEVFNGTSDQAVCSTLHTAVPDWNDPKKNTAYIYIRLEFDQDVFSGVPQFTVLVDGMKVYNPDTDVTEYSNNPALIARDFITRTRGGMGITEARIDDDSVIEAADYCDMKGWECDIVFKDGKAADMIEQINSTYRGAMLFSDDTYKLKFRDLNYETPVMEIDDDMVVEQGGQSTLTITQPSIFNTPNAVRLRFVNAEKSYTEDDYQLVDLDAQTADGYIKEQQIDVRGIIATENVMKMANYFLERLRLDKTASLQSHSRAIQLEPHDLIWLTHTRPGWDEKIMRVLSMGIGFDGNVALSLEEEYDQFYDDTYEITDHVFHDTDLPNPKNAVPSISNASITEEQYYYRGRSFTRLKIDFENPLNYPWFSHCDVYLRVGATGDWKYMTTATDDYQIDPVEEGETYYARLVSVSIWGTKESFASAYTVSHSVVGATDAPADVTGLTAMAAGDSISIFANEIDAPDIFGYEVRSGASWAGGMVVGQNETPNIRLVGMKPGTITLWMKALTNAGEYSVNAVSTQVTVFGPSGYAEIDTWSWDYDGIGTHDNTEHHVYDVTDCLRCSHSGPVTAVAISAGGTGYSVDDVLTLTGGGNDCTVTVTSVDSGVIDGIELTAAGTEYTPDDYAVTGGTGNDDATITVSAVTASMVGTWTSPIYDLGSIQTVRIWGDFITGVDSDDLTWGGVFGAGDTWGDKITAGERWFQVWTPSVTGGLIATLKYGDTSPPDKEITNFELSAPEISGRYVQVEVQITDPNLATHLYVDELTMRTSYWS